MTNIYTTKSKANKPYNQIYELNGYKVGFYFHQKGIVKMYQENTFVCFDIIVNSVLYSKNISNIKKPLTERQFVLAANKFVNSI